MNSVSILLPMHNEQQSIEVLVLSIENNVSYPCELIFVDDGSTDQTVTVVKNLKLTRAENKKKIVLLSRNFGHQRAIMAGLSQVDPSSKFIVVMDSDLQDKPEDISRLFAQLEKGFDCAYAVRPPAGDSKLIDALTKVYYKLQQKLSCPPMPMHAGSFSAFNRTILDQLLEFGESELFFPGLRSYVGHRQVGVEVERGVRQHGKSRVGFVGLIELSLNGLLGFSSLPMRAILLFGLLITFACAVLSVVIVFLRLIGVIKVLGFTSLALLILSLLGIQIVFIGLVGEYVGKLFIESKRRPRWIVKEVING